MDPTPTAVTFADLLTPPGVVIAGAAVTALTELLKRVFPALDGRVSGMQIAFGLSLALYVAAFFAARGETPDPNLPLVALFAWISCATSAVGIHQTVERARVAAAPRVGPDPDDEAGVV